MNQIAIRTLAKASLPSFRALGSLDGQFPLVFGRFFATGEKKEGTEAPKEVDPEMEAM